MVVLIIHKYKVPHILNYFKIVHEKGENDKGSACIKIALCREEFNGRGNKKVRGIDKDMKCENIFSGGVRCRSVTHIL